jgi:tetratricopeptide (TPR) repeat protein
MVTSPLAIALLTGFASVVGYSQGSAMLDGTTNPSQLASPVSVTPRPPLTPELRGDIFMARKMYREAIESFQEGPKNDATLWNKTGIAYHQLGQLDKAKKYYERAVKLKPNYAEAQNNIGTVYYAQKSYRRAVSAYKKALKLHPDSASIHMNLGTAYFARKKEKDALLEYQAALNIDPEVFEHRGTYGIMLEERNVEDRARYHYALARLYAAGSRQDLALQYLRKALEEGFKDRKKIAEEPAFEAMRENPEFKELLVLEPRVL